LVVVAPVPVGPTIGEVADPFQFGEWDDVVDRPVLSSSAFTTFVVDECVVDCVELEVATLLVVVGHVFVSRVVPFASALKIFFIQTEYSSPQIVLFWSYVASQSIMPPKPAVLPNFCTRRCTSAGVR